MRLLIERRCDSEFFGCVGAFTLGPDSGGAIVEGYTAENPWRDNRTNVSCIPAGSYRAILHNSPKFGRTLWIRDVPGRSEILVHVANSQTDVRGCIGPGDSYGWWTEREELAVWNSQDTLDHILQIIQDHGLEEITVEIRWHHPEQS